MRLYIKRIPKTSPLGITTKKNDIIHFETDGFDEHYSAQRVPSLKGKNVPDEHELPVDYSTGEFIVWSKENVPNPYKSPEMDIPDNWILKRDVLRKEDTISEQMLAELKFNQPQGFFTAKRSWTNPMQTNKPPKTFLETLKRKFHDTNTFDDENGTSPMEDYIWIKSIMRCVEHYGLKGSLFAKDLESAYKTKTADYYIHDSDKESVALHNKVKPKLESYAALSKVTSFYSLEQKYKLWVMILHKYSPNAISVDKNSNDRLITDSLIKFVMGEANDQNLRYQIFIEQYTRMETVTTRKEFDHEFFLVECIRNKVLVKSRGSEQYSYLLDGNWTPLANMKGLLALNKKENKETLEILEEQLKAK